MKVVVSLVSLVALCGCFEYTKANPTALAPGSTVVADLTLRGMVAYEQKIGPEIEHVQGTVVRQTPDSIEMRVSRTTRRNGDVVSWGGEPVVLDLASLSGVSIKKFSVIRTATAGAAVAVAVAAGMAADLIGAGSDPGSNVPGGGKPGAGLRPPR